MLYIQTWTKCLVPENNAIIVKSNPWCYIFLASTVDPKAALHYSSTSKGQN